ncbi:MAG: pilin [Candidatus Uhrbacteria bacterium]
MSKKALGYFLGGLMALALVVPALHGHAVHAAAMTQNDYFGTDSSGSAISGDTFASSAGLSSGDLPTTIASLIRVVLGILGIIAVVIILIGGFKWMTSGGNDDKVKSARKVMTSGIIGLVIVLSAFAIAQFVLSSVITATSGSV